MSISKHFVFHGEELLAPRPTPKLKDRPLSAVRDCLFKLFAAALHIGGRSSIRNLRMRHAVVTGTHKHGANIILQSEIIFFHVGLSRYVSILSKILRIQDSNVHTFCILFCSLQCVYTESESNSAPCSISSRALSLGVKWPWDEVPSSSSIMNIPHIP